MEKKVYEEKVYEEKVKFKKEIENEIYKDIIIYII